MSEAEPSPAAASPAVGEPRWWLEAQDKVWGPYPHDRLAGFVREGRLTASSLVGRAAAGPFAAAALDPELTRFFLLEGSADASPGPRHVGAEFPTRRPLLVFAALRGTRVELFESAIAAQGETMRVAPGLWVVRAPCAAAPLRNQLSRRMGVGEVLWVSELDADRAAWFALPGDTDRSLRRLLADGAD